MGSTLWFLLYFCLFSLKIPLLGESVVGPALRVDDVLIALAMPLVIRRAYTLGFFRGRRVLLAAILWFVGEGALSGLWAVIARETEPVTALAYSMRPLEYASFAMVGFLIAKTGQSRLLSRCLTLYAIYFTALCVMQVAGLDVGASQFAFTRAAGNTSGPYEAAVVAAFLFFFFVARGRWLLAALPLTSVLLTDSRITTFALVAVGLLVGARRTEGRTRVALFRSAAVLTVAPLVVVLGVTSGVSYAPVVSSRIQDTQLGDSWDRASAIERATPAVRTPAEYEYFAYPQLQQLMRQPDASSLIRFARWQIGLKAWANDPSAVLLGMGPSFAGAATDGYYVRLLVGQGLLGGLLFLIMIGRVWAVRHSFPGMNRYLLVLLITACFIDIFVSYRPMLLMWLGVGVGLGLASAEGLIAPARAANPAIHGRLSVGSALLSEGPRP